MSSCFQSFWGKAHPHKDAVSATHPVVAHALDVAAVALLLPRHGLDLDGRTLGWLVSLHDIGKFSRTFQAIVPKHWPTDTLGPLGSANLPPRGPKHDALVLHLLQDAAADLLDDALPPRQSNRRGWTGGDRVRVLRAIGGHHGRPISKPDVSSLAVGADCEASARAFVEAMSAVFQPPPLPLPADGRAFARLEWSLALQLHI